VRLVIFATLARMLAPEAFGLVTLALVFIGLTQVIADQGLADAIVQRKALERLHLDSAFWMSMGFGTLLAALLSALAVPLALVFRQDDLAPVLVVLALSLPISSASLVQKAILTRQMAFRSLALRTLISIGVGAVFGIGAALMGFGVWSLVAQHLASPLTGLIVLWSVTGWRPRFAFSVSHFRELFGFGVHIVNFRVLNYLTRRADELLIGAFLGAASLGYYTVGYRMLRMLFQLTSSLIDRVAFPLYSRLQDEPDRLRNAYYKTTAFAALVAFPTFTTTFVLAPEIVAVLFGPKWETSVPVMQALTVLGVVQFLTYLNSNVIKACGKPSWQVGIVAVTALLKVIAFSIAVRGGIVGVAIAAACVGYLVAPAWYWAVRRLAGMRWRDYGRHLAGPALASLLAGGVMALVRGVLGREEPFVTLLAAAAAGVAVFVVVIYVVARPLAREARDLVRRALPRPGHSTVSSESGSYTGSDAPSVSPVSRPRPPLK
jgi:PST family polysaccharide transporter